ncbi:MAG: hypothetical protein II278_01615 [Bacteroidaceae bacterium]|jgi:hypothetical protein|nr:hypothetical protein [Bacteroidaceae bacterium]
MNKKDNTALKQLMEQAWPVPPQPAGSRERFAQRLSQARGTQRRHWFYGVGSAIGIAASVIIAFLMLQPQSDVPATELSVQQTLSAGIAEVKGYYKAQMWSETEFIMELSKNLDPELRQRLLMEVRLVNETPDSIMLDIMKQEIDEDQKIYYITSMYMAHLRSLKYMHEALSDKTMAIK